MSVLSLLFLRVQVGMERYFKSVLDDNGKVLACICTVFPQTEQICIRSEIE